MLLPPRSMPPTASSPWLAPLAVALMLSGCAKNTPVVTDPSAGPLTYASLLAEAHGRPAATTLQGTTKMRLTYPGRSVRLRGVLVAQAPANLRAEVLSLLGQPVAYLAQAPQSLALFSPYSGTYLTTGDPQGILAEIAGDTLRPEDLVGLLLGQTPPCTPGAKGEVKIDDEGGIDLPCMEGDVLARTLRFDASTRALIGVKGAALKGGTFEVTLGDHALMEGAQVPQHITFEAPALELVAELEYEDVVAGEPVDPGIFVLTVPEGPEMKPFESLLKKGPPGEAEATPTP